MHAFYNGSANRRKKIKAKKVNGIDYLQKEIDLSSAYNTSSTNNTPLPINTSSTKSVSSAES